MHFNKFGQTYQLQIASEQDILNVLELDESLWVASSAPVTSFRTDSRLLNHIDHDGNGRINTREVKDAILWTQGAFGGLSKVHWGADHITSDAISSASPDGQKILDASAYIHNAQKSEDRNRTTLAQVRGFLSSVRQQVLNGDGAVVPEAAQSDPTKAFIEHIIQLTSGTEDASGKMGVTRKDLATFMNSVHAFLNWRDREHQSEEGQTDVILPLGEKTVAAHALVTRLSAPIEHYFNIVSAIHFRPELRASLASKADETDGDAYAQSDPLCDWLARFPIAEPCDDGELPLEPTAVNPIYRDDLQALRDTVIAPVLGDSPSTLSLDQWKRIRRALKCFADYLEQKQGADVESLPVETLRRYADGQDAAALEALIDADEKVSEIVNGAQCLEKAILYQKYLLRLLNNFVSFTELYTADQRALFESGSLLIDGRWFNLALRVDDAKTHSIMAKGSNIFIIYLEITRQSGKPEYTIAVPATAGTKGNLVVGKRGVFFDLAGREFDARILQIIENPISLTEALCLPFHRLWAFILGKIEALSSSSEKELQKATDAMLKERTTPVAQAPAGANSAMLMGLSVSVAALGSAFAFISSSLAGMTKTQLMSSVLGAAALVIVPVSLVAIFKLRRQDLSALLEGCGWGVNARMRFTFSLRRQFTCRKPYPSDATGAPRSRVLIYILIGLLAFMGLRACNKALLAPQPDSSKVNASTQ